MKRSEELKKQIDKLQVEYNKAKQEESLVKVWDDAKRGVVKSLDTIGFFNLTKARLLLTHLDNGDKLLFHHQVYGKFKVYMNPQRNRILVENLNQFVGTSDPSENNIMGFIVWHVGDWYVMND